MKSTENLTHISSRPALKAFNRVKSALGISNKQMRKNMRNKSSYEINKDCQENLDPEHEKVQVAKFDLSKSRNHTDRVSLTVFSLKNSDQKSTQRRKIQMLEKKVPMLTMNTSCSTSTLKKKKKNSTLYSSSMTSCKSKVDSGLKRSIKPVLNSGHERSKSSMKSFAESIVQITEGFRRSLINFKTDILGLKRDERYSAETENLVKLIQKYSEKLHKLEHKFNLRKSIKANEKALTQRSVAKEEYFLNDNFIDILGEKEAKISQLAKQVKLLSKSNEKFEKRLNELEDENSELQRKLKINDKHEEIENIVSKLGSMILANKMEENLSLRYHERQLIKELFSNQKEIKNSVRESVSEYDSEIMKEPVSNFNLSVLDIPEPGNNLAHYTNLSNRQNSLSSYKQRASKGCLTQRRKKRNKTRDLTYCKSIDLMKYARADSTTCMDEVTSCNDTQAVPKKRKQNKVPELLSMLHCQAKMLESQICP